MKPDWTLIAAWIGALGGLSGFATLVVTGWWRRQDRKQAETERIAVHSVSGGPGGLSFWVSFDTSEKHEQLEVTAKILTGSSRGPFIEGHRKDPNVRGYDTPRTLPPSGHHREFTEPLSTWLSTPVPKGAVGAHLFLHGSPAPQDARIKFRVGGKASGKVLATRVFHVAS
jgi:hypothetical protein